MVRRNSETAESMIRRVGARITRPRLAVLTVLLDAAQAMTHVELAVQVRRGLRVDRVTVYRVLDWLIENRLAHRIAGDDRVWRYNAATGVHTEEHVHFQCSRCGRVTCLDDAVPVTGIALPPGFRSQHVEVTVKGLCADCPRAGRQALHRH